MRFLQTILSRIHRGWFVAFVSRPARPVFDMFPRTAISASRINMGGWGLGCGPGDSE